MKRGSAIKSVALSIAAAAITLAQTPDSEKKSEFEVASIRPAKQDGAHDSDTDKGIFRTHNLTLKRLISQAYGIDNRLIFGGPNWVDSDSYDINAKIPEEFAQNRTKDKVPQMLQSLLADRFQLVIHREPRQISGYALIVTKKGPKIEQGRLEQAKPDDENSSFQTKNRHLTAQNATMERFAEHLSRNRDVGMMVVNKTGLTGGFNFELEWGPERPEAKPESSPDDRPSIFTALQERLGLKLESAKIPASAIVIDRAEKPEGN